MSHGGGGADLAPLLILMCVEGVCILCSPEPSNVLEMQLIQHSQARPHCTQLFSQGDVFVPPLRSNSWNCTASKKSASAAISSLTIKRCAYQDRWVCIKLCAWCISCGAPSEFLWQLRWNSCYQGREAGVMSYYRQVTNATFLITLKRFLRKISQHRWPCETVWAAGCWEPNPGRQVPGVVNRGEQALLDL